MTPRLSVMMVAVSGCRASIYSTALYTGSQPRLHRASCMYAAPRSPRWRCCSNHGTLYNSYIGFHVPIYSSQSVSQLTVGRFLSSHQTCLKVGCVRIAQAPHPPPCVIVMSPLMYSMSCPCTGVHFFSPAFTLH